ncbi:MAG TPA: hypothetical protein VF950_14100 [Planctomycetota bacterium]
MICPTCQRPLPAGSRTCLRCPRPASKAATKPAPSDDLLTDEPPPEPSAAGRAAAAAAAVPIRPRRRTPLRSGGGAKFTIGGALAVLLVIGGLGLKVCRVSRGILGETIENKLVTLEPEGEHSGTLDISGSYGYTFTVTALDGPVHMGVSRASGKTPSEKDIFTLVAGASEVARGSTRTLTGKFSSGYYLWAVLNDSETAPARVKISFSAR